MAAPSGTVWGSIVGDYGRVGIHVKLTHTNTHTTRVITLWFWSKYGVSDSSNTLYYDAGTTNATSSKGAVSISTSVSSGSGWSTSNQVKLKEYSHTYARGTSDWSESCAMKLSGIDRVGGTMTASTKYTVPKLASYTVAYNANGGSGAPSSQTKYYGKTLTLSSIKPIRTGYTFQGWATSATGSVVYALGASYTANASVTLYAKWSANPYTVAYNGNATGVSNVPASQTKWHGTALTLSTQKPTLTGHTFLGWATSATGGVAYAAGASYTANAAVTLFAKWSANTYTVSYDANGGSGQPASQTKTYGKTLVLSNVVPKKANYNFKGWGTSANATTASYAAGANYTANVGITLYAIWELAYTKPRISSISVFRCDDAGNPSDDGTNIKVAFSWETDKDVTAIIIEYKDSTATMWTEVPLNVETSGTNGSIDERIQGIGVDASYDVRITVADGDTDTDAYKTPITRSIAGASYPIDVKKGGVGVAFGKPAEKDGFECELDAYFNNNVYGSVWGLNGATPIPDNSNLNDYRTPGVYSINTTSGAATIVNIPLAIAGVLIVSSGTGKDTDPNPTSGYQYVRQQYFPYDISGNASYERALTYENTGSWVYGSWIRNARVVYDSAGVPMVDVANSGWIKTPALGLLPNAIGTSGSVGSSTWRFKEGYFKGIDLTAGGVSWIDGKNKANSPIQINTQLSQVSYHPIMWLKTYSSHIVNLGGYINNFGVYGILSSQTANATNWQTYWDCTNGNLIHNQGLYIANNKCIFGTNTSGTRIEAINLCSASNNLSMGYGGYAAQLGATYIYGNSIYLTSNAGRIYFQTALTLNHQMNLGTTKASDGNHYYINNNGTGRFNALRYVSSQAISSRRYKNNIDYKDSEYWHDSLMQIKPCTFYYKNDNETKHIGLIAEDLFELIPDLVDTDDEGKPASIEYANLTIPLIGEVQRLNNVIDEQQAEIYTLKQEMQQLKELVAKLVS